ncbi:extracellular solute-binding protein [Bacillus sp. PS06]|uniref:extracellular solute-binding protein n=1 Tax=Bacillus sp. PS06 TaxID=2764176 RepID=UPI00177E785A|nr:extracellular solute-binding protein [Bacillus sp. PS06]MBD8067841.1 extracellular solute-binding protein [Bacillus sp. PS06]
MKKVLLAVFSLALVFTLAACKDNSSTSSSSGGNDETIRIMSHFFNPTPPSKDNEVEQKIEEATGVNLNIEWVSANNYAERFNVLLASQDMPDLMLVPDPFSPTFRKAAEQGAFWDVSPYIDQFPNLKNGIADIAWELTSINGKSYSIPRPRPVEGEAFFVIRKDWLDNLGLEVPTTSDELLEVMRAFTEDDPDGNGQNDTIGFTGYVNDEDLGAFGIFVSSFTGVNGEWKEENGELIHTAFLPETRQGLEYVADAYEKGYITEDFASLQVSQAKEMFMAGKAGIISEKAGTAREYYDALSANNPDIEFVDFYPLTSINGYNPKGAGFAGTNAIPKSVPEEKMLKILGMINDWMEEDVFVYHKQGIEGVHHTVENGEVVIDTDQMVKDAIGDYNQIVNVADPTVYEFPPNFPEEADKLYTEITAERAKTSVANIGLGLYSETGVTYLPELRKKIQDLNTKIILGTEDITAWDKLVEELKNDGNMQKLIEEINEAYKSR